MTHPLQFLEDERAELVAQGAFRLARVLDGAQDPVCRVDGREVVNLSSNNYLALANHPRLRDAAIRAVETCGAGSASVRTIAGTMAAHVELEQHLARFKHTEAAVVFQSGFTSNAGTVGAILGKEDVIVSDALNHASIIDGCRLSRATIKVYKHADVADLRRVLDEVRGQYRRTLVVTDGVFSMDGDVAPLPDIVEAAEAHGAIIMVDDAHASGVLGHQGRGTVDHFGLHGRVHIQVGTLSKAIGVLGGYVAGPRVLIDMLHQRGRPFLFSTSHPPAVTAAVREAFRILEEDDALLARLWDNTRYFKDGLKALGFDIGVSTTPITPVIVGDTRLAMRLSDRLFEEGVFCVGIGFPTVPRGSERVRAIVSAGHARRDLDKAIEAFGRVGRELDILPSVTRA